MAKMLKMLIFTFHLTVQRDHVFEAAFIHLMNLIFTLHCLYFWSPRTVFSCSTVCTGSSHTVK